MAEGTVLVTGEEDFLADVLAAVGAETINYRDSSASERIHLRAEATPARKTRPTWYMVANADQSINADQERMMAKCANANTVDANASHVAYMSDPKETANLIEEAATSAPVHQ